MVNRRRSCPHVERGSSFGSIEAMIVCCFLSVVAPSYAGSFNTISSNKVENPIKGGPVSASKGNALAVQRVDSQERQDPAGKHRA